MNKTSILIVEDDRPIRNLIVTTLKTHEYKYLTAENGREAILEASSHNPDIILLDLGLPDMEGVDVIKKIRTWSNMPIIVISARSEDSDKIEALDAGADDYITKPFSMSVLIRKIAAILRRSSQQEDMPHTISYRDLILDLDGYKVYTTAGPIDLTPREFEILRELLTHKGRILTRQNLLQTLWKYEFFGDERIIDTHIKNLRKKLGQADYIETIRGVGYRIDKED